MVNEAKKVKVRLYSSRRHYELIEVDEKEVAMVKEENRFVWRRIKNEERERRRWWKRGITIYSLERWMEDGGDVENEEMLDPEEALIIQDEIEIVKRLVEKAIMQLPDNQKRIIDMYFYQNKSLRDIAIELGVYHNSVYKSFNSAMKNMKNFIQNSKVGVQAPQKVSLYSEGEKIGGAEQ